MIQNIAALVLLRKLFGIVNHETYRGELMNTTKGYCCYCKKDVIAEIIIEENEAYARCPNCIVGFVDVVDGDLAVLINK